MGLTSSIRTGVLWCILVLLASCDGGAWNNPYPQRDAQANTLYSRFSERPKHLDPVQSYSANEWDFLAQIYEPPFQYHFLKRPYTLVTLTATDIPQPQYLDAQRQPLPPDAPTEAIAWSVYEIEIQRGIRYQPHPAFARDEQGRARYIPMPDGALEGVSDLSDFEYTGTRELRAADYVYQIKRLAHPRLHSPVYSIMAEYIVGMRDYGATLKEVYAQQLRKSGEPVYLDLRRFPLAGAEVIDDYRYRITVKGKYPQLLYWLAMPFFAPVPQEVDQFYSQAGMSERNLVLDWYPVGTGPYMLTVNNPNRKMVLERNPNFHGETYPDEGMPQDRAAGLLDDAGKPIPFIDKVVFSLEKEDIPYWNKFLQGYYDASGIASDNFDQAVQFSSAGDVELTPEMRTKGIKLTTSVETSTFYLGFNMLDPVVGGYTERARKLRRAIAIAVDYEELISIFRNGRGVAGHGPIPPGIFGYQEGREGINPYVYTWHNGAPKRRSVSEARSLLAEAGYPNGRDERTGKALVINLDTTGAGPEMKSFWDWYKKQFRKINVELRIRNTDYNRFQQKVRDGNIQLYTLGWNADYPDPENFFFLLYGRNGKVKFKGENASNYANPEFDRLFEQMKHMDNSPQRLAIIERMLEVLRRDGPWLWGFHPTQFVLHHSWYKNSKPHAIANNTLKYKRIDAEQRARLRRAWNQPHIGPLVIFLVLLVLSIVPAIAVYMRKERRRLHAAADED